MYAKIARYNRWVWSVVNSCCLIVTQSEMVSADITKNCFVKLETWHLREIGGLIIPPEKILLNFLEVLILEKYLIWPLSNFIHFWITWLFVSSQVCDDLYSPFQLKDHSHSDAITSCKASASYSNSTSLQTNHFWVAFICNKLHPSWNIHSKWLFISLKQHLKC